MEGNVVKKMVLMLMMVVMGMLVFGVQSGESAIAIPMNPCTLPQCIAACKKALKAKYMSASCSTTSQGKLCICLGGST
ncbi:ACT domain repeat 6 isoform 1 [Senna tora]|uniref:ACT domain repeat 6 isoform 1 n=1 Tax=Senna tora TaxID=362788 RepID=A0A834WX62_9FABA|nr:ACT domain repeat 6 isoform 1 [Senna tora]